MHALSEPLDDASKACRAVDSVSRGGGGGESLEAVVAKELTDMIRRMTGSGSVPVHNPFAHRLWCRSSLLLRACPALHMQSSEPLEVVDLRGDEDQVIGECNRRNLAVSEWRRLAHRSEPSPFEGVPVGRLTVVIERREASQYHFWGVSFGIVPAS